MITEEKSNRENISGTAEGKKNTDMFDLTDVVSAEGFRFADKVSLNNPKGKLVSCAMVSTTGVSSSTALWMILHSRGLFKTEKQVNFVLVFLILLMCTFSFYIVTGTSKEKFTPEEKIFLATPPGKFNP